MQLALWGQEPKSVEHWIECIHFDGWREIVSTLDASVDWRDRTVAWAGFVKGPVENSVTLRYTKGNDQGEVR